MKNILIIVLCCCVTLAFGQQEQRGKVSYRVKRNWVKIAQTLPWISDAEKQRMEYSWGKASKYKGTLYELDYTKHKSIYQKGEEPSTNGYSWNDEEYTLVRDYDKMTANDRIETLGKNLVIEDYPKYKWKIRNEIKEVAGYLCMKAETVDEIKDQKIVAWFTSSIPVHAGPDGFYGLPGMILEINKNDGAMTIVAEKVEILEEDAKFPKLKKAKGKKMTRAEYDNFIKKFIEKSIKSERNPYWSIKY